MKHVLIAFLLCICVTSSLASGKKYTLESATVEVFESEGTDCDDKDPPFADSLEDFIFSFVGNFCLSNLDASTQFAHLSDFISPIELDYFCPPPNPAETSFTLGILL
jgi:hypothetical protein